MFAAISSGHADFAEVLLLVAFILAAIVTVVRAMARDVAGACLAASLGCAWLSFLVL